VFVEISNLDLSGLTSLIHQIHRQDSINDLMLSHTNWLYWRKPSFHNENTVSFCLQTVQKYTSINQHIKAPTIKYGPTTSEQGYNLRVLDAGKLLQLERGGTLGKIQIAVLEHETHC